MPDDFSGNPGGVRTGSSLPLPSGICAACAARWVALAARMIRKLHAGRLERLAQGDADIFPMLAVDHYLGAGERDGQTDRELQALLLRPAQSLSNHATGEDAVADLTQLARFVADVTLQFVRTRDSTQDNFH